MLAPPSLRNAPYYPVTSSVGVAAIALWLIWFSQPPPEDLVMNNLVWEKWQLWRAITSTVLHGGFFHLAFNLYWLWTFGTLLERVFGSLRCAGIFVLFALGSMLADYAVSYGGIGLSGVVYGFWGMLWVLASRDERFQNAVDKQTSQMFIIWFFLCIVLTVTNVWHVANVAHGVGALMGVLLGFAICGRRQLRRECIAGLVVILSFAILWSTVYWPTANFSPGAEEEVEAAGVWALKHNDGARGVKLLERAAHMRHAPARMWYNLGLAYLETGRLEAAAATLNRAAEMPDADQEMRDTARAVGSPPAHTGTNQLQ